MLKRIGTPHLLFATSLLVLAGLVMLYSASAARAEALYGTPWHYVLRQCAGLGLGVAGLLIAQRLPLAWLERLAWLAYALAVVGLLLTWTPLGVTGNGARRWLALGPLSFQPLEPAKLGVLLGLARWLATHRERMDDARYSLLVPGLLAGVPALLLLAQPDFGGALLLVAVAAVMVFVAGARLDHLAAVFAIALPTVGTLALATPYRLARMQTFLDPWRDPLGAGYQLIQSQLAFGAGGMTGVGLGSGQQKLFYLPEAHNDFILSVIAEEAGLFGVVAVLGAFALVATASAGIAARARTAFGAQVAVAAGLVLWLQAAMNAGVAMGALPTTGVTLPFVSYGGTSLAASVCAVGLLLCVSQPTRSGGRR